MISDTDSLGLLARLSNNLSKDYSLLEEVGLPRSLVNPLLLSQFPFILISLIINPNSDSKYKGDLAYLFFRLLLRLAKQAELNISNNLKRKKVIFKGNSLAKVQKSNKVYLDEKFYNSIAD